MQARFVPPPGWPTPPRGWHPPPGWTPDPSWPPAPPGWRFWLPYPEQPVDPYVSPWAPPPPTPVRMGAYRVDNAAAWALALGPLVVWVACIPVRLEYPLTWLAFFGTFVIVVGVTALPFYALDRTALRQAGLEPSYWTCIGGPVHHLINRSRYAGQTWAMPVLWFVGVALALLV